MNSKVRRALATLFPDGGIVELRALTDHSVHSGYFDNFDTLAEKAANLDTLPEVAGIYVTLNAIDPALLSRRANRVKMNLGRKDPTTSDSDVLSRRWLPIDLDPVRPSGVSSTDTEHAAALAHTDRIRTWLGEQGFPDPVMADSGNGAHLLYRIDLLNDDESTDLVKGCLAVLDTLFSDGTVSVDAANFNAARIWKLYGTTSKKGDNTPSRPHRQSCIIAVPEEVNVVPIEQLRHLASLLPKNDPDPGQRTKGRGLDLHDWLNARRIGIRSEKSWQGGTLYVLDECPFSSAHRDGAFAIQFPSGAVHAGCQHASCGGGTQRWPELRERFEPRIREKRERGSISHTAPIPSPPVPPLPPAATIESRSRAAEVLQSGDPLALILDVFHRDHVGDRVVAECLILSVASQSVLNTQGLHVAISGNSGKGKTHACRAMLSLLPEKFKLKGTVSDKALYYHPVQPGTVLLFDDVSLSEDLQEILKSATASFREPIEHRTLTSDRQVRICTIPERCVWWLAKVELAGDDQVMNRMLCVWIDDSADQDAAVLAHLKSAEAKEADAGEDPDILVCRAIWDLVKEQVLHVRVPFAPRVHFSSAQNRRNPGMLFDLIKAHALLRCLQREEATAEDGSPCIVATRQDFADAVRLYDHLNGTAGGQETKLTKVEASVLDVIARAGWPEFTVQQLQQVTGRSSSSIRKVLHGYVSKGYTYSGLLEKCPAISYTDRTVVSENEEGLSVRRRTTAYQFSPDLYRTWARGGSCWLEDEKNDNQCDNRNDNQPPDDGSERRNDAEKMRKNSAQMNGPGSENGGKIEERSYSVHNRERNIPDTEQQDSENISAEVSLCDSTFSATGIANPANAPGIAEPSLHNGDRLCGTSPPVSASSTLPPGKRPGPVLKVKDFKKLDIIKKDLCVSCGRKTYLSYIEKLTDRRRKLPPTAEPWYVCKECYQEMVGRERSSAPPLPGMIDVDRMERVTVDIGRCTVCGLEKAVWSDRERGVAVCEGCWGREVREEEMG